MAKTGQLRVGTSATGDGSVERSFHIVAARRQNDMHWNPVLSSRIQFAFTIRYHILWPAYTIGVSGYIVLLNSLGW